MYTREELYEHLIGSLQVHLPRGHRPDLRPGSAVRTLIEVMADGFTRQREHIDLVNSSAFITKATGVHLDLHGQQLGIQRIRGTVPMVAIEMECDPSVQVEVPAGTRFYAGGDDGLVPLESITSVVCGVGSEKMVMETLPVSIDDVSSLTEGQEVAPESPIAGSGPIKVIRPPTDVSSSEEDEPFRTRLINASSRTGPCTLSSFAMMTRTVDGVVRSYPYNDPRTGPGVATILIEARENEDPAMVSQRIMERLEPFRPAGIRIVVRPIQRIEYKVRVKVVTTMDHKLVRGKVRQAIQVATYEYFEGLGLGTVPAPDGLRIALSGVADVSSFSVQMEQLTFNKGTVSLEMGPDSKAVLTNIIVDVDRPLEGRGQDVEVLLEVKASTPLTKLGRKEIMDRTKVLIKARDGIDQQVMKEIGALVLARDDVSSVSIHVHITDEATGRTTMRSPSDPLTKVDQDRLEVSIREDIQ